MAYEFYYGARLFVAVGIDGEADLLHIYEFYNLAGLEGLWRDPDYLNPIYLPEQIGPGAALAFQPVRDPASLLSGYLYLLVGGGTRSLYRRAFNQLPWAPTGMTPGEGDSITLDELVLDWTGHRKWESYQLQISSTRDFLKPVVDVTVTATEFRPPKSRLMANRTYYWRVRGLTRKGESEWSEPQPIVLSSRTKKRQESRVFPPQGALMSGDEPMFNWECVPLAVKYQLQVADNEGFKEPVIDVYTDVSEFRTLTPLPTGKWFWRTRWQDAAGIWSEWGAVNSFAVEYGWQRLPDIPSDSPVGAGGAMCYVKGADGNEALYVLVGNRSKQFWRFLPQSMNWQPLAPTAHTQRPGSSITSYYYWEGSSNLSALMGGPGYFRHYSISEGEWGYQMPVPRFCPYGSSIVRNYTDYNLVLVIAGEFEETNFYKWVEPLEEGPMAGVSRDNSGFDIRFSRQGSELRLFYQLDNPATVRVAVFDHAGRMVRQLFNGLQPAGKHDLRCDPCGLGTGIYFLRLDINGKPATLKLPIW